MSIDSPLPAYTKNRNSAMLLTTMQHRAKRNQEESAYAARGYGEAAHHCFDRG
jgi:hypothetical protein